MTSNPRDLPPPHDLDAEAAVLSAIMLQPEELYTVQDILRAEDFYSIQNELVFRAIEGLDLASSAIDWTTVASRLRDLGQLDRAGGVAYLAQLTDCTPDVGHVREHALAVASDSFKRRLIRVLQQTAAEGYGAIDDAKQWGHDVEAKVYRAARWDRAEAEDNTMSAVIPELVEDIQKRRDGEAPEPGIPSGFQLFDRKLGGWRRKPYIIAGRPGMGKSALVAQCCAQVAVAGYAAILISLEMDRSELATRLLSSYARVPYRKIESADLLESQWNDVKAASHVLRHIPLSIVRAPAVTVARVRTIIRQEMARLRGVYGEDVELGMVAVDYVQLIDGEQRRNESRDSELSRVSKELQWISAEFGCALLEAAQLNRGVESRPDKRPRLSDLRESGSLEQDAYAVLFPFREAYYDEEKRQDESQVCDLIVAKHRNGPGPTLPFMFRADCMRFDVLETREEQEAREIGDDVAQHWSDN